MSSIDLRKCGPLKNDSEDYLASLIAFTCSLNEWVHQLSLKAKEDFQWDNSNLAVYVLAGLVEVESFRVKGFISSGEWLNGVLTSGEALASEHIRIIMSYVNPNAPLDQMYYLSGKDVWKTAPNCLKTILDTLDDACLLNLPLTVAIPTTMPTGEEKVKIIWSEIV